MLTVPKWWTNMRKKIIFLFALSALLVLWANARTVSNANREVSAGNIPDGMYTIVGWASRRCLEVPNSSCGSGIGLQTFDCDPNAVSNNQKFNVVSDGSGNYTISPAHSDLCLEVSADKISDRTPVLQSTCSPGKPSQKWAMTQAGDNLEIRAVLNNQCVDIVRNLKGNFAPAYMHACNNGTNQRWTLHQTTLNNDQGVICRASLSHPEYDCDGMNDQQKPVHLGKTLTKARCEEACKASGMVNCHWQGNK